MPKSSMKTVMVGLFILGLFCSPALAELGEPVMYDDFNAKSFNGCKKCIDTTKWRGQEQGDYIGEIERSIAGKRAFFAIRGWGEGNSNEGRIRVRSMLHFKDDPETITGVCFTPRVKKMELNDCEANDTTNGGVQLQYFTSLYDNNSNLDDTQDGVVSAGINMSHSNKHDEEGLKSSEFAVNAFAELCLDEFCEESWNLDNTGGDVFDYDFGIIKKSNKEEFCVAYDPETHELIFSVGDDVRIVDERHNLPFREDPVNANQVFRFIGARITAKNCDAGMVSGYMEADIDNVRVSRDLN